MTTRTKTRRHTLCWGTLRHLALADLIGVAGRTGFAAVTASVVQHGVEIREKHAQLVDLCHSTGVQVECVEPIISPLPGLRDKSEVSEQLRAFLVHGADDVFECAVALGARSVNIAHFLGRPHDLNELASAVDALAVRADSHGLLATVEFIPGTGIASLDDALRVVSLAGRPNVRLVIDVWHVGAAGMSASDLDRVPQELIHAVQLCDKSDSPSSNPSVFSHRLLPGHGSLPLQDIVAAAFRNNPRVDLQVEVFNDDLTRTMTPDDIAVAAHDALDELV